MSCRSLVTSFGTAHYLMYKTDNPFPNAITSKQKAIFPYMEKNVH